MKARMELATRAHHAALAEIYRPAVADSSASFELVPPDGAEMGKRADAVLKRTPWIVCQHGELTLGYAYASHHRDRPAYQWSVEVSAYVRPAVHRAGVGRALYTSLFAVLELQGFRSAFAGVTLPNDASVGLHRSVGFTRVGIFSRIGYKNGVWHDVEWLERPIAPHVTDPPSPTPLPELLGTPELAVALAAGVRHSRLPAG
jgi:L-amino acid N-acyltransferase YncA